MRERNQDLRQFSKELKLLLHEEELFDLLPGCGWKDGGCRSLMKAMLLWLGEEYATPYLIVKRRGDFHGEHAFVKVGAYFIDGDGVSTRNALYKRWRFSERMPSVYIQAFSPEEEPNCRSGDKTYYISDESIRIIANSLEKRLPRLKVLGLLLQKSEL